MLFNLHNVEAQAIDLFHVPVPRHDDGNAQQKADAGKKGVQPLAAQLEGGSHPVKHQGQHQGQDVDDGRGLKERGVFALQADQITRACLGIVIASTVFSMRVFSCSQPAHLSQSWAQAVVRRTETWAMPLL